MAQQNTVVQAGLEGVVAAATRLSAVDGLAGELIICGYKLEDLAPNATFEEVVYLLWHHRLPAAAELDAFQTTLAARRTLPELVLTVLEDAARRSVPAMDALRTATGMLDSAATTDPIAQAQTILAQLPTIVAAYHRFSLGQPPVAPDPELGHAANHLWMLTGTRPDGEQVRALETYLNTVVDHGLNASTFAARVIIATRSDLVSAITGAIGALKGPLHGGAPGPALDMVFEIGSIERAEPVLRDKLASGERLMGFGHRVYRVRDPRADVLAAAATRLYASGSADMGLYDLAREVEQVALRLLEEHRPGRNLQTNVEYYTALLLHGLDLPTDLFTPTFAISRAAGWLAHCFEQIDTNRIIRPESVYVGETGRQWVPRAER
jgi:citrate synthase